MCIGELLETSLALVDNLVRLVRSSILRRTHHESRQRKPQIISALFVFVPDIFELYRLKHRELYLNISVGRVVGYFVHGAAVV